VALTLDAVAAGQQAGRPRARPSAARVATNWADLMRRPERSSILDESLAVGLCARLEVELARAGHAFGIALAALGHSESASQRLNRLQVADPFLRWLHRARLQGGGRAPANVARALLAGGEARVICLMSPSALNGGHTLLAQGVLALPGGGWGIRVLDPNVPEIDRPLGSEAPGWLYIDEVKDSWRYRMADGSRWEGGREEGGELHAVPNAVLSPDAPPFAGGMEHDSPRALIVIEGEARTAGLTDGLGRTLFGRGAPGGFEPRDAYHLAPESARPPVTWWTAFGGLRSTGLSEAYFADLGVGESLHHRLRPAREGAYRYTLVQAEGTIQLSGTSRALMDTVTFAGQVGLPVVSLEATQAHGIDVAFEVRTDAGARRRVQLANLGLRPGGSVAMSVDASSTALTVDNRGRPTAFDLCLERCSGEGLTRRTMARLALGAGERTILSPGDWESLEETAIARLATVPGGAALGCDDEQEQLRA
jgi:hypothetical protein